LFQERFEQFVREQREPGLHGRGAVAAARSDREPTETEKPRRAALAASVQSAALAVLFAALPAFTSGCHRVSQSQARQLVERYNNVVSEAYRRGDVNLIDPVVGPNEGRKLIGLIGVRLDLGLTLDSQLLSLEVTHIEQTANQLQVGTKEHWTYRDLQIGTGKQLGDASQDYYKMNYYFTNVNQTWLVDEIKFTAPPQVGRTNTPWIADRRDLPGATAKETTP